MGSLRLDLRFSRNQPPPVLSAKNKLQELTKRKYKFKLLRKGPNFPINHRKHSILLHVDKNHYSQSLLKRPWTRVESKLKIDDPEKFVNETMPVSEHIKNQAENPSEKLSVKSHFEVLHQARDFTGKYNSALASGESFVIRGTIEASILNNEKRPVQTQPLHDNYTSYSEKINKVLGEVSLRLQESERVSLLTSSSQPILSIPELPSDFYEIYDKALKGKVTFALTPQDLITLAPRGWLNDEIINHSLNLVLKRSLSSENTKYPKIHVFNTFFYTFLKSGGHARVKKWTRKIDIFSLDLVLIPVHLGHHWCMAGIDFRSKRILYFDSMLGSGDLATDLLLNYVTKEYLEKKGLELNCSEWKLYIPNDIPIQDNGYDCGVFAIMFGRCLASPHFPVHDIPKKFPFSQADMPNLRQQIAYEIITDQLLF